MKKEPSSIPVWRYRDAEDNPTCIGDARTGDFCPFFMTSGMGTREHCYWSEGSVPRQQLERREDGRGTTIPHANCPLWGSDMPGELQ